MYRTGQEVIKERDVLCELEGRNLHGSVVGRIREAENVSDSCKTVTSVGVTRQRRRSFCINLSFENKFGPPSTTRGHLPCFFHNKSIMAMALESFAYPLSFSIQKIIFSLCTENVYVVITVKITHKRIFQPGCFF